METFKRIQETELAIILDSFLKDIKSSPSTYHTEMMQEKLAQ